MVTGDRTRWDGPLGRIEAASEHSPDPVTALGVLPPSSEAHGWQEAGHGQSCPMKTLPFTLKGLR